MTDEPNKKSQTFVGRDDELSQLIDGWPMVQIGQGKSVAILAESGVGKSRLVEEFIRSLNEDLRVVKLQCVQSAKNSAFYPLIDYFSTLWQSADGKDLSYDLLQAQMLANGFSEDETIRLWQIISNRNDEQKLPADASPRKFRQEVLKLFSDFFTRRSDESATIIVIEDLHWIDPSTLAWLNALNDELVAFPILLLLTAQPDAVKLLDMLTGCEFIELAPFDEQSMQALITQVSSGDSINPELKSQLIERSAGNPLMLEELTRSLVVGPEANDTLQVPENIAITVRRRLDVLADAVPLANLMACVGRSVSQELLKLIASNLSALEEQLQRLADAAILEFEVDASGKPLYRFRHALVQEQIYDTIPVKEREANHRRIAEVLNRDFFEKTPSEMIAFHFEQAHEGFAAMAHYRRAGDVATARYNNVEAATHYQAAIRSIENIGAGRDRDAAELALTLRLAPVLAAWQGFASEQTGAAYARAEALCTAMDQSPLLFKAMAGLEAYHLVRANYRQGLELSERLVEFAAKSGDDELSLQAHLALGANYVWSGDPEAAITHLAEGSRLYNYTRHKHLLVNTSRDVGVACLSHLALALGHLGYVDKAQSRLHDAHLLAQKLQHPFSIGYAWNLTLALAMVLQDFAKILEIGEQCIERAVEQQFPFYEMHARTITGIAMAQAGNKQEGKELIQQGLTMLERSGSFLNMPHLLSMVAEIHALADDFDAAWLAFEKVDKIYERCGSDAWLGEVERLKGCVTLRQDGNHADRALPYFRKAVLVNEQQNNRLPLLRALNTLVASKQADPKEHAECVQKISDLLKLIESNRALVDTDQARALLAEHS